MGKWEVGRTISHQRQLVHYVRPKPEDLAALMDGIFHSQRIMKEGEVPAVIHAAAISHGVVFMHPFEDGNGRAHRFLFTPRQINLVPDVLTSNGWLDRLQ